jgi:peptide/nickel transport system substrate-binding protein
MKRNLTVLLSSLLVLLFSCSQPERRPEEVRVRLGTEPENLSPANYSDASAGQIINLLFQSLLTVDLADNTLKPALAVALPTIEIRDSLSYFTYEIREEATWTDGSPVTAADVAFTLKVLKAPLLNNEHVKSQVSFIRDIILFKENNRKFTFVCDAFVPEMELLTGDFFILPANSYDPERRLENISIAAIDDSLSKLENNQDLVAYATRFNTPDYTRNPSILQGSAGYTIDKWVPGQYISLKRKENWWGNKLSKVTHLTAKPERITLQIIPEITTAGLALKNRQLDVLSGIPVEEFEDLRKNEAFVADYQMHTPDTYSFTYAGINTRSAKFSDKRTRQAIAYLLDHENIIKVSQNGYATATVGPVPPSVKDYYNTKLKPYTYNLQKAKELLKAAGWMYKQDGWYKTLNGKEEKLTIAISYKAGSQAFEQAALVFQQGAAKAGVPVTLNAQEGTALTQNLRANEFEMMLRSLTGNPFVFNFEPLFHTAFTPPNGLNYTNFGTPESDKILEQINKTNDSGKKAELLKRLQAILADEAAIITLYYEKDRIAIHKRFANTKISGLKPNYDVSAFTLQD